ncbi:MAG: DUF4249 domain-containing protein [Muribaculaceae bacterium]|nr:DUF4249 domain-containing protein [Muribaculaceae bacterium]
MKGKIIGLLYLFMLFLAAGCEKEIDIEYHDIEPILVIEGSLTQDGAEVALTLTTPMDEPFTNIFLTDAKVSISDLTVSESFELQPDSRGIFISSVKGVVGHSYRLDVERGGEKYSAVSAMLPPTVITGMEFSWIKMPYDEVAVLQVSFTDDSDLKGERYWLRLYRNGKAYKWTTVSDHLSSGGIIDEVMMTSRRDLDEEDEKDKLEEGDVVTALLAPVSQEMHDYLEALSVGNSNGPRMFQGSFCLGYFLAAPVSTQSILFPAYE